MAGVGSGGGAERNPLGGEVAGVIWVLERTWQGLPGRRRFSHPMCDCRSPGGRKSSEGRPFSTATGQVGKTRAGPALSSQALCGETLSHPLHILLQSPRTVQEGAPPLSNSRDGLACRSPRRVSKRLKDLAQAGRRRRGALKTIGISFPRRPRRLRGSCLDT